MLSTLLSRLRHRPLLWLALALSASASLGWAQQPARVAGAGADPPARVSHVTDRAGGIVFSPEGDDEWQDLPPNRPLTTGDRLWSDRGGRVELHLGTATLHLDEESHVGISALDDMAAQLILLQGSINARVRELAGGENFEIDTPHLAFRAREPGDYRIDVDPQGGYTRVTVRSGTGVVYGEGGQSVNLGAGQSSGFGGRFLAPVQIASTTHDGFAQWAAERNAAEDRSVSARYVPRGVVGYPQLDAHGSWSQDPTHGTVWYPRVAVQDWAPYRYGRWTWVAPWGWTWVDDAPWGFAPFHYGRWALIGSRWAWVPGALAPRPIYAPALVTFFGDGGSVDLSIGGPAVGWYPLGPGEAWWPTYRATPVYLGSVNWHIDLRRWPRDGWERHVHRHHGHAITAVRTDDFRRGRPVREIWRPVAPSNLPRWQAGVVPQRPDRDGRGGAWADRDRRGPNAAAPWSDRERRAPGSRPQWTDRGGVSAPSVQPGGPVVHGTDRGAAAVREQQRAQREQWELQREQWDQMRRQRQGGAAPLGSAGQPPAQPQQVPQWQRPPQQAVPIGGRNNDRAERAEGRRGGEGRGPRGEFGQRGDAGQRGGWEAGDAESRGIQNGRGSWQRAQ